MAELDSVSEEVVSAITHVESTDSLGVRGLAITLNKVTQVMEKDLVDLHLCLCLKRYPANLAIPWQFHSSRFSILHSCAVESKIHSNKDFDNGANAS
eukprot:2793319-Amphidinium_carterae.1